MTSDVHGAALGVGRGAAARLLAEFRAIAAPPPPSKLWLVLSLVIVGGGLTILGALIVAGHLRHAWPAHYLQDGYPGTWLTAGGLAAAAMVCGATAHRSRGGSGARFWCLAACTLLYLATDDALRIHENIDLALHAHFSADPLNPITDRLDDLIVLTYGLLAARYAWRHRGEILRVPWAAYSLAAAFVLFLGMVVCDASHLSMTVEDSLKTASILLILTGCLAALIDTSARHRRPTA